jgi:hypothetical protein
MSIDRRPSRRTTSRDEYLVDRYTPANCWDFSLDVRVSCGRDLVTIGESNCKRGPFGSEPNARGFFQPIDVPRFTIWIVSECAVRHIPLKHATKPMMTDTSTAADTGLRLRVSYRCNLGLSVGSANLTSSSTTCKRSTISKVTICLIPIRTLAVRGIHC